MAVLLVSAGGGRALCADVGDFLGRRVTSVEIVIEGAPGSSTSEMRALLEVSPGQDYSPVRIRDSLSRLYRSGIISGARVEATAAGADGVTLRFVVKPQARIDNVVFQGTTVFPASALRARLNELDPGDRLSLGAVERGLGELVAFYTSRGYYQAKITSDIELDSTGTLATVVYRVEPGPAARVSAFTVDVRGARIDLSKIEHAIREGQVFTQAAVGEEMEQIRRAYIEQNYLAVRVSDKISADVINNTVAVTISVESGPLVIVEVEGLELSDEKKREILPIHQQGGLDDFTLEEGRRSLQDYAQRQGYFFAEVTRPTAPTAPGDTVRLNYVVETGARYRLTDIDIEGVDAVPSQELQDQMKSREASIIPFFGLNRGLTSNELLRQDANLIQKRLRELGYRRSIVEVRRGVSVTGDRILITFAVEQGPRTHVESIDIRGNNILTSEMLRERLTIEAGDPFLTSLVTQSADHLNAAYNTRGYANSEVISELVELGMVEDQERIRLIYSIFEGNRVRIRNVNTRGVANTSIDRLEQDFYLFKQGEWLRQDQLQETERVLYDTNAFNTVTITSEPIGQFANGIEERDVTVDLTEAKPYLLIYGFGFQSSQTDRTVPGLGFLNGGRALIQLTNSNMFGKLYTGSAQMRVSQDELLGQLSFQDPRPFGKNYPVLFSLFARRLAERSFSTDRYTAIIQIERRINDETIAYLGYNFERISNFDLPEGFIPEELERNRQAVRLSRLVGSFARDSRDNAFEPNTGQLSLGSVSLASKLLGGNEQFGKFLFEHSRYYPVSRFRDTVYSVSGRLGLASPYGGAQTLPISERFFAGGPRDLRGFGFEEAGPRGNIIDPATGQVIDTRPLGGNALFVINNELRFPIYQILGGTLFSDTGNVFRRVKDFRPQDLTQTIGFGLRVKTPIGPVRLDFAFLVLNRPAGQPTFRRHFTFGTTF